jgi:hypothetical protein
MTSGAQEVSTHLKVINVGHMATRMERLTQASHAPIATLATKLKPLRLRTWEAVKPTRNDVSGQQL